MNKLPLILAFALVGVYATAQRLELRAPLSGITATGKAKWKTNDTPTQKEAQLEVEVGPLQRGRLYKVTIAGRSWIAATDTFGKFRLSQRYLGLNRPNIVSGTVVVLRNASTNAIVATGTFR